MARKEKKYHYIYKTTCLVTRRFYVGMHSTDNLDDGYQGSGRRLRYSINKHGCENHTREILEFLPDRTSLREREGEIITEKFMEDPLCMNLKVGGEGGFDWINENAHNNRGNRRKTGNHGWKNIGEFTEKRSKKVSSSLKDKWEKDGHPWLGKIHSAETKEKIGAANSVHQQGQKNSQFGTCWINNGLEVKKIKKSEPIPEGWKVGRK